MTREQSFPKLFRTKITKCGQFVGQLVGVTNTRSYSTHTNAINGHNFIVADLIVEKNNNLREVAKATKEEMISEDEIEALSFIRL